MVRPSVVKQLAVNAAIALSKTGDKPWRWQGFRSGIYARDQDSDDEVEFSRGSDWKGRIRLRKIRARDLVDVKVSDPVTIGTPEREFASSVELTNRTDRDQKATIHHLFRDGSSTMDEVRAGFSITSKTTIGTGQAAPVNVQQEFSATVSSEWTKQTGITKEKESGGTFEVVVPSRSKIRAWIEWDEATVRRHIEGQARFDCEIRLGKRAYHRKYSSSKARKTKHWYWGGSVTWDSVDELVSTLRGEGSVKFSLAKHFRERSNQPSEELIKAIELGPRTKYSQFVEYKDIQRITVDYVTVAKYDANGIKIEDDDPPPADAEIDGET